jgi:hypothetical protein
MRRGFRWRSIRGAEPPLICLLSSLFVIGVAMDHNESERQHDAASGGDEFAYAALIGVAGNVSVGDQALTDRLLTQESKNAMDHLLPLTGNI